jgi:molecular chaperone DnaJ
MKRERRKLEVRIPAGIDEGMRVQISGAGDAGPMGGPAGDLLVSVAIEPDPVFRREGDDLVMDLPLTFTQAALGDVVSAPTIDGEPEHVKIPAGTQPGAVFRIRGKGATRLRAKGRGDLLAVAAVQVPTSLTPKQRTLLEALDASFRGKEYPADTRDKSWRNKLKDALGG